MMPSHPIRSALLGTISAVALMSGAVVADHAQDMLVIVAPVHASTYLYVRIGQDEAQSLRGIP